MFTQFDQHNRVIDLSDRAADSTLKMRQDIAELLLARKELGVEAAKSKYVSHVSENLTELSQALKDLRGYTRDAETLRLLDSFEPLPAAHAKSFQLLVDLYTELGRAESGLEERFRNSAEAIEARLTERKVERLMIGLLTLRKNEVAYRLRGRDHDADNFRKAAGRLQADISAANLSAGEREEIQSHLKGYLAEFDRYVGHEAKFESALADVRFSAQVMDPIIGKIHDRARKQTLV